MSRLRGWCHGLFLLLVGAGAVPLYGQSPAGLEVGLEAVGTFAGPDFGGGGVAFSVRPGGDVRATALVAPGVRGAELAARGELLLNYLLAPERRRGPGLYGIGGIGGVTGRGSAGYVVLGVGLESAPGGRSGWNIEAGVGGGFRLAAGWRLRWLHRSGRSPQAP